MRFWTFGPSCGHKSLVEQKGRTGFPVRPFLLLWIKGAAAPDTFFGDQAFFKKARYPLTAS